jgi:hypothetical protein
MSAAQVSALLAMRDDEAELEAIRSEMRKAVLL